MIDFNNKGFVVFRVIFLVLIGFVFFGCSKYELLSMTKDYREIRMNANIIGKPFVQLGHTDRINTLAITPNGKYLISGSHDNTVKLWDIKSNKEIRTFYSDSAVQAVVVMPNGKNIIVGSSSGTIIMWDIESGKELKSWLGHKKDIKLMKLLSNGKYLLSVASYDSKIKLWDTSTGEILGTYDEDYSSSSNPMSITDHIVSIAVSPNEKYMVTGSYLGQISLWNLKSKKKIKVFKYLYKYKYKTYSHEILGNAHQGEISNLSITADGKSIISGSWDKTIKIWDIESGKINKVLTAERIIVSMTNIFNSKYMIYTDMYSIFLVNIKNGKMVEILKDKRPNSVALFVENGKYLYTGDMDNGKIKKWNIKEEENIQNFQGEIESSKLNKVSFKIEESKSNKVSLNQEYIVSTKKNDIVVRNIKTNKVRYFKGHTTAVKFIEIVSNGNFIVSQSETNKIKLWDIKNNKIVGNFNGFMEISAVKMTENGKNLVLMSDMFDEVVVLLDIVNAKVVKIFKNVQFKALSNQYLLMVFSNSFDKTGKNSASHLKVIKVWDIEKNMEKKSFNEHQARISSVYILPNQKYVVSGDSKGILKLWEIENVKNVKTLKGHSREILSIKSISKNHILTHSKDFTARIWSLDKFKEVEELKGNLGVSVSCLTIDKKNIFLDDKFVTIKLFDMLDKKLIKTFKGHSSRVKAIFVSKDGNRMISKSVDNIIKVWDIKTGKELVSMISFSDGEWITITPDGYFDASKNGAKHLNILTDSLTVTSIDAYYEKFYRPNIVKLAMEGKTVNGLTKISDIKSPPKVEILNGVTETEKESIEIRVKITPKSGGVGDIRIYQNGTAISDTKAFRQQSVGKSFTKTYKIQLVNGKNEIKAIAFESTNSARSEYSIFNVVSNVKTVVKPNIYALVIGIEEFRNPTLKLDYPQADAKLFGEIINAQKGGIFNEVFLTTLNTKESTSKENILAELKKFKNLNKNDLFVLYISSHGTVYNGEYFLITSNVGSLSNNKLKNEALSGNAIKEQISNIPTLKKLMVFDTCHSGALGNVLGNSVKTKGLSEKRAIDVLNRATGSAILSASTASEEAIANGYKGYSIFTYLLVEGLKGLADSGQKDGFIKTSELAVYMDEKLPEISKKEFEYEQFPVSNTDGQAFPVSWIRR
jgi:WD40 repeat protein